MRDILYIIIITILVFSLIFTKSCCKEDVFKPKNVDYISQNIQSTKLFTDSINTLNKRIDSISKIKVVIKGRINKNAVKELIKDTVLVNNDTICKRIIKEAVKQIAQRDSVITQDSVEISSLKEVVRLTNLKDSTTTHILGECQKSSNILFNKAIKLENEKEELVKANKRLRKNLIVTSVLNVFSALVGYIIPH